MLLGKEQIPLKPMSAGEIEMPCPLCRRCGGGVIAVAGYSLWLAAPTVVLVTTEDAAGGHRGCFSIPATELEI